MRFLLPASLLLVLIGCSDSPQGKASDPVGQVQEKVAQSETTIYKTKTFEIALPQDWDTLDLTQGDFEQLVEAMAARNPSLAQNKDQIVQAARAGVVQLLAFMPVGKDDSFRDNVNVTVMPSSGLSLEKYVDATRDAHKSMGIEPEGEVVAKKYAHVDSLYTVGTMKVNTISGTAREVYSHGYFVKQGDQVFNLTFTVSTDTSKGHEAQIQAAMNSFKPSRG